MNTRKPRHMYPLLLATGLLSTACSGAPSKTFRIDAVDVEDQPVPCIVVVEGDWAGAAEKNQLVNVGGVDTLPLTIEFTRPEMNVIVAAVPMDPATGKPLKMPKSRDESKALTEHLSDVRDLRLTDQERTLFILRLK